MHSSCVWDNEYVSNPHDVNPAWCKPQNADLNSVFLSTGAVTSQHWLIKEFYDACFSCPILKTELIMCYKTAKAICANTCKNKEWMLPHWLLKHFMYFFLFFLMSTQEYWYLKGAIIKVYFYIFWRKSEKCLAMPGCWWWLPGCCYATARLFLMVAYWSKSKSLAQRYSILDFKHGLGSFFSL